MHRVARIQQHIQHHLLQLALVPMDVRQIGVQLGLDPDLMVLNWCRAASGVSCSSRFRSTEANSVPPVREKFSSPFTISDAETPAG